MLNSTTRPDEVRGRLKGGGWILAGLAGTAMGALLLVVAEMETRWIVWAVLGALGTVAVLAAPQRERLLRATFVLSLQIDMYFRVLYGYAGGEGLAFPLAVLAGAAFVTWRIFKHGPAALTGARWIGPLALPIAAMFLTTFAAILTTSEQFVGLTRLLFELELLFVYWIAMNLVQSKEDVDEVLRLLFTILVVQGCVYFLQSGLGVTFLPTGEVRHAGEIPRPGGTVSTNPAGFASAIMPMMMIATAFFLTVRRSIEVRYAPLLTLIGGVAIGLTFTRAAWAGLVLGSACVVVLALRRGSLRAKMVAPLVAVLLLLALAALPAMIAREKDYSVPEAIDERSGLMRIAVDVIESHPLTGVGPGAYRHVFKSYVDRNMEDQWLYEVHNEFLLRAAETGIPGGLAFIWLIVAGLRVARRLTFSTDETVRIMAIGWFAALIALAWQMQWVPWRGFTYNAILWFMLGLMDGIHRLSTTPKKRV